MNFETIEEEKNETIKTFILCFYWEEKTCEQSLKIGNDQGF